MNAIASSVSVVPSSRFPSATLTRAQFTLTAASVLAAILPHLWRLPLGFSVLILGLLAARWWQRMYGATRFRARISAWVKVPLVLVFPALVIAHYGSVFGREPGSALACAMLVLKLVESENRRDARAAIAFASFVLMSALLFDGSLVASLVLFTALALLMATLRELEPRPANAPSRTPRQIFSTNLRSGATALLSAVPLAACVFLFFPRLGAPLWGAPADSSARTGLGDRMSPGNLQELLIDDSPAFRVTFDKSNPPPRDQLYWRGPVLWDFDGTAWTRTAFVVSPDNRGLLETSGVLLDYEITQEPSGSRWLLALDMPLEAPSDARRSVDMTLISTKPIDQLLRYRARSAPRYRLEPELSEAHRRLALRLPAGFNPRARVLADQWRHNAADDNAVMRAALELFHKEFFYTLSPPLLGLHSVDDFLFETHRGFCEHYASAFVFLMRAAGIPSRVVTGYQGGYFNSVGNYFLIRQSDAHAWAEVWLAGRGWVRVDPTASVSPERVEYGALAAAGNSARWYQAGWLLVLRNQLDLVNRGWNDVVVQFSALRQQNLLQTFGVEHADYSDLLWVLIGSSSVLLILFSWWVMRVPRGMTDPLDLAYASLCRKLSRVGITRAPAEGPLTLRERTRGTKSGAAAASLLDDYIGLRYATKFPGLPRVREFAQRVRRLKLNVRA